MDSKSIIGATCVSLAVVSFSADAALVSRLGGLAYYDTEADLTWLADANAAVGSAYDTYNPGTGVMNWADANAWAAGLDVAGVTGWRLADTLQPDVSCSDQSVESSRGFNCTGSEMGNLFYNVFGGIAGSSIEWTHNANYDLFSNVQSYNYYWSATEFASGTYAAWNFNMYGGKQSYYTKESNIYAWAVQSGDAGLDWVAPVPIPSAVWIFGSGLIGLIGVARRKKA